MKEVQVEICEKCDEVLTYDVYSDGSVSCNFDCKCSKPVGNIDKVLAQLQKEAKIWDEVFAKINGGHK